MSEHHLKTLAPYFDAMARGQKWFEVRRDDRGFEKGDVLILHRMGEDKPHRYDGFGKPETTLRRRVAYILTGGQFGIEAGYVVMSLEMAP